VEDQRNRSDIDSDDILMAGIVNSFSIILIFIGIAFIAIHFYTSEKKRYSTSTKPFIICSVLIFIGSAIVTICLIITYNIGKNPASVSYVSGLFDTTELVEQLRDLGVLTICQTVGFIIIYLGVILFMYGLVKKYSTNTYNYHGEDRTDRDLPKIRPESRKSYWNIHDDYNYRRKDRPNRDFIERKKPQSRSVSRNNDDDYNYRRKDRPDRDYRKRKRPQSRSLSWNDDDDDYNNEINNMDWEDRNKTKRGNKNRMFHYRKGKR